MMDNSAPREVILSFPAALEWLRALWRDVSRGVADKMPKGLYARSLLIVILPMVLLQSIFCAGTLARSM